MKTPAFLRQKDIHRRLKRLEPPASRLRKALAGRRPRRPGSHSSRVGDALPHATGGALGRLVGSRRR